jgi:transglutaminase-like putative cysteine protease
MRSLTIRHVTRYRYRKPVAFGEHRMMLRPRDSHDQRVIEARIEISPEPISLRFVQDAFGNHVGIARFSGRSKELRFESVVSLELSPSEAADADLEHAAKTFPVYYSADERPYLAHYIERHEPDAGDEVGHWAQQFLSSPGPISPFELLTRLSQGIHRGFRYRRREAKGIQPPVETLRLGHGSCRDFAMLLIEAARSLGLAARFASGYLTIPFSDPVELRSNSARGATHAWAQIYVPGTGWIDFDPTSGGIGRTGLVTVAVVRDPVQATPLHGTFFGSVSDAIGMDVQVRVISAGQDTIWVAPQQLSNAPQVAKSLKHSNSARLKSAQFA